MLQFLFCSTVFNKRQYTIFNFEENEKAIQKLSYLLTHRADAVIWPVFTRDDVDELLHMDESLAPLFRGLTLGTNPCRIRYNGKTYQLDEIVRSRSFKNYWNVTTDLGHFSIDPTSVWFVGANAMKIGSF